MGSLTVNRQDLFPPGTTVSAYANQGHGVPVSGPPSGMASASGVVPASGELTFTGLTPAAEYILYAASPDRYLRMLVPGQPGGAAESGGSANVFLVQDVDSGYPVRGSGAAPMIWIGWDDPTDLMAELDLYVPIPEP